MRGNRDQGNVVARKGRGGKMMIERENGNIARKIKKIREIKGIRRIRDREVDDLLDVKSEYLN
jgi:hypothetical protein